MTPTQMSVITIIAEAQLEQAIDKELSQLGAKRASRVETTTYTPPPGGTRLKKSFCIRIEVITPSHAAQEIVDKLYSMCDDQSSVVCFISSADAQTEPNTPDLPPLTAQAPREMVWGDYIITV